MSSNSKKTAVLKKKSIYYKLKLQSKGLSYFRFSIHLSEIFLGLSYGQMYRKFKKVVLSLLVHVTPLIFFSRILRSEALVYKSYFFRRAFFRKLFDIRFSYKHCNFSRVCLLVKMVSKSVTRSIQSTFEIINLSGNFHHSSCSHVLSNKKVHVYYVLSRKKQAQF